MHIVINLPDTNITHTHTQGKGKLKCIVTNNKKKKKWGKEQVEKQAKHSVKHKRT